MKNKQGVSYHYDILIAAILAILVIGILGAIFFKEIFGDTSLETCRQSIILRANAPELKDPVLGLGISVKEKFPLKCKNGVETIDYNDTKKAELLFAEQLAQCWYLYLKGEQAVFPSGTMEELHPYCTACARIHFSSKVGNYYEGEQTINVQRALKNIMPPSTIAYERYVQKAFQTKAFNADAFGGETFKGRIAPYHREAEVFSIKPYTGIAIFDSEIGEVYLPKEFNTKKGDIYIMFRQVHLAKPTAYDSSLIYFQAGQQPEPFAELAKPDFMKREGNDASFCEEYEGVLV